MITKIAWRNLIHRPLSSALSMLLMALGIGLVSFVSLVSGHLQERFSKNSRGIDMVVGAKGSPLQLILSSIYQLDSPTGNVPLAQVNALKANPLVKHVIPLSMGDNVQGIRIVGTTPAYLAHFKAELAQGKAFSKPLEVVLGSDAARQLGFGIGSTFHSSHGLDAAGESHAHADYRVVGILKPTNSVADQLVITSLESVWAMHEHADHHEAEDTKNHSVQADKEDSMPHTHTDEVHPEQPEPGLSVTAALVQFRSPMGLMTIPRTINENTVMQAALPSIEVNRLFELLGVGIQTLRGIAFLLLTVAGLSVFIALYNALKERKYELAVMLTMGGSRGQLLRMLLLEGLLLGLGGFVAGWLLSRLGVWLLRGGFPTNWTLQHLPVGWQQTDTYLLIASLVVSVFAAFIPSSQIYRLPISKTLASE